jgi:hypothetical protein
MHYHLVHAAPASTLEHMLATGLAYGSSGRSSQESHAQKTNALLDALRPTYAVQASLSRQDCLYAYLALDGSLLDVEAGKAVPLSEWRPAADDAAAVLLDADPTQAWVSDLDAYDALATAIEQDAPIATLHELADRYWQRLVRLDTILEHYTLRGTTLAQKETAPGNMPRRFNRAEVLLTASIPPEALHPMD